MIDFSEAPDDAIERLMWLSGAKKKAQDEIDAQFAKAYFEARLTQRFDTALSLKLHSTKKALAFTRGENERRGRPVRWGDRR